MRPNNDNNVYILGAGFSAAAGLPTLPTFLSCMRDAVDWLEAAGRSDECSAIDRVLEFRHKSAVAGYRTRIDLDNVEDLFSLSEAQPGARRLADVQTAIAATIDFATRTGNHPLTRFIVSPDDGWPCTSSWRESSAHWNQGSSSQADVVSSAYDYCAALMAGLTANKTAQGRNTIISLNYDLLLEESFKHFGMPVRYGFDGTGIEFDLDDEEQERVGDPVSLFKLHGSLNWGLDSGPGVVICSSYDQLRKKNLSPMLLAPTWRKAAWNAFSYVWDGAVSALGKATRIVILGFSIPPSDQHFKYLISAGLGNNSSLRTVEIVDPRSESLRANYESVFRADQFDYGIVRTCAATALDYFYNEEALRSLGRLPEHPGLEQVFDNRGFNV